MQMYVCDEQDMHLDTEHGIRDIGCGIHGRIRAGFGRNQTAIIGLQCSAYRVSQYFIVGFACCVAWNCECSVTMFKHQ